MSSHSESPPRQLALEVVQQLRGAGYEAYWAGGCVRDQLLGNVPKDYDVATSARPNDVRKLFGERRTIAVGVVFGVIAVLGRREQGQVEIATFREDDRYTDGRHPDSVQFSTAEADAQRRDFTINGLFYDPLTDQVIDYVNGRQDLTAGCIQAIGVARDRIAEDKLRMLRGIRFAAKFEFEIEAGTYGAICEMAPLIDQVSPERIGQEMERMLIDAHRGRAMDLLADCGLLRLVLPAMETTLADPAEWQSVLRVLAALENPTAGLALAALLHRDRCQVERISQVASSLRWPNQYATRAAWILAHAPDLATADRQPWPRMQRLLVQDHALEALMLREAIVGGTDAAGQFCREKLALPPGELNPRPVLSGNDLLRAGYRAGPEFKHWLRAVRDAQLTGEVRDRTAALRLVEQLRDQSELS